MDFDRFRNALVRVRGERRRKVNREQKAEFVAEMKEALGQVGSVVIAHYAGLTVAEMSELRANMRESGGRVKVAKNRLMKRAIEGGPVAHLEDLLNGQTLIAYGSDAVAAPKVLVKFAKDNENLVVLGGAMGETRLDAAQVKALSDLPSLDELRAKLAAVLKSPAQQVAMVAAAPASQLARTFSAYAATGSDAADAA